MARLVEHFGEKQVAAIVLVAAYANFQDRLLLALGVGVEKDGPLPPIKVRFRKPALDNKAAEPKEDTASSKHPKESKRKLSPPDKNPPPVPEKVTDPEWTAFSFETLRERLAHQKERRQARVSIPDAKAVLNNWPDGVPRPESEEMRIKWCRLAYGHQPRLTAAWLGGLDVFQSESDLDHVFHESMFWVVTRSLQCFY
jgi:hypothetical protein